MSIWTIIAVAIAFYMGMLAASIFANRRIIEAEERAEAWAIKYAALIETVAARTDQASVTENDTREGWE